jgi:transcriptional regulator with XRE-family HTH domain
MHTLPADQRLLIFGGEVVLEREFKDEARRRELADFLTSRRKRLTPASAGLRSGRRRLTSGLRREEVAELAGVGTTWYTWLEQARDIRPSEVTLLSIARALQLTKVETKYLLDLALERGPRTARNEVATPALLSIMNGSAAPAFVMGQWWDILAYNAAFNAVLNLDHAPFRNLLQIIFTPQFRALHPNFAHFAKQEVGLFRAHNACMLGHPAVVNLVSDLTQRCPHFRECWVEQKVSDEMHSGHVTFDHPVVGHLFFDFELLGVLESPGLLLQMYVCDGVETRTRLDELVRQQQNGENDAAHNIWTALAPQPCVTAT